MNKMKRSQWGAAFNLGVSLICVVANEFVIEGNSLTLIYLAILSMGLAIFFQGTVLEERIKELST